MNKAFIYALLSAFILSFMSVLAKMLGQQGVNAGEITFFRGLIGTVAVVIYMYLKQIRFSNKDFGMLVMRGVYGGAGNLCNFIAVSKIKITDAAILFQLSGIFVFIFSSLFLKEKLPKGAMPWLILIFLSVLVIINPFSYESFSIYALAAVLGAAFAAAAYTTIRGLSMRGGHSTYEIMFYFLFSTMVVGGIYMIDDFVVPNVTQWLLLIGVGIVSVIGQFFLTGSFIATNAVVAQFLQYIGVFYSAMWGFLIFDESLSWLTVSGGIVMFISSVMISKLKEMQAIEED